ncbi:Uncharacterised protein [Mycobacteroides abscessus subsp. abscessus]|nr:Uncharacterised protein [Mycobacteroides abscessus subsp. abscessus]
MINTSWPVAATHSPLSITPAAGSNRDRAATSVSSERTSTACRQSAALTAPGSGTVNAHPPAPSSAARKRSMLCRSSKACNMIRTAASVTPAGACSTTV